ncbi:MAG: DUF3179 domain-containing protein [Planctomycetaceae bacterium]|nr:DUF3179 domain-containing protein [Planctomycetaceae bacterium]
MNDAAQPYDFSQQAEIRQPRIRTGLAVFTIAFAAVCGAALIFRDPLFEFAGSFLVPAPPPDLNPDDVVPAGLQGDERLMYTLSEAGGQAAKDAVVEIAAKGDQRYVAVLLEALIAAEESPSGHQRIGYHHYYKGLMKLIGGEPMPPEDVMDAVSQRFMEWYTSSDLNSPSGYVGWKGNLLGRIDPVYGELFYEGVPANIRIEEVRSFRRGFDLSPTLNDPQMIPASEATYLSPEEPVFGIEINGEARAYPERILQWHTVVNDVIHETPVTLAYCANSGTAAAYDGRGTDGNVYTFGASGLIYRGNQLLFDRETRTLWSLLTGEPVIGKGVDADARLNLVPTVVVTWDQWRTQFPETTVLSLPADSAADYKIGAAHGDYSASQEAVHAYGPHDGRLPPKSRVYGLEFEQTAKAFALSDLAEQQVVNDTVGGRSVVLVSTRGTIPIHTTFDFRDARGRPRPMEIDYDAGGEVRVYARNVHSFQPGADPDTLLDETGRAWKVTTDALVSDGEERLPRINGVEAYWFAWSQHHVGTDVFP